MVEKQKLIIKKDFLRIVSAIRRQGKTVAFTNGCFDILHYGHVYFLQKAKRKNRVLIVGLNSDTSVRKIKGPGRPFNTQKERAAVLSALSCVDYVTIFSEETPYRVIKAIKPDILIKGADWKGKKVAGEDIVKENGGKLELIQYLSKYSTTKTLKEIKKNGRY